MADDEFASVQAQRRRMRRSVAADDDDAELLAQQQRFLLSNSHAAAKVIRATRPPPPPTQPSAPTPPPPALSKPRVSFAPSSSTSPPSSAAPTASSRFRAVQVEDGDSDDEDDDDDGDSFPHHPFAPSSAPSFVAGGILSEVVERQPGLTPSPSVERIPLGSVQRGFPATFKIRPSTTAALPASSSSSSPSSAAPKKSLFALQRERMHKEEGTAPSASASPVALHSGGAPAMSTGDVRETVEEEKMDTRETEGRGGSGWKAAGTGGISGELAAIRAENERKVAAMSAAEVAEAQEELSSVMSPALLAVLRKRGAQRSSPSACPPSHPPASIDRLYGQLDIDSGDDTAEQEQPVPPASIEEKTTRASPTVPPPPAPFIPGSKTAWMEPLPSPTSPPDWAHLTWDTGIAAAAADSSTSSSSPSPQSSSSPIPPPIGTAWPYWRVDFRGRWLDERVEDEGDRYDGLHHHGEHADRAGYSLREAVYLCHSSHPSQRVVMLHLLSHVLTRIHSAHDGYSPPSPSPPSLFGVDFNALILEHLLALHLCTTLRTALDDPSLSVMTAATRCLLALLTRPHDQRRRDALARAYDGHLLHPPTLSAGALRAWESPYEPPTLHLQPVHAYLQHPSATNENVDDEASCMKDVVVGLVQMKTLPRLRYILDIDRSTSAASPSSSSPTSSSLSPLAASILAILVSVAQHSPACAVAVAETPHLLALLASMVGAEPEMSQGHAHLLLLLCLLSSTSSTTLTFLSSHSAILHSLSYLLLTNGLPDHLPPPPPAPLFLSLSALSLRLWRRAIAYGQDLTHWLTFFPVLMRVLVGGRGGGGGLGEVGEVGGGKNGVGVAEGVEEGLAWQEREAWGVVEALSKWVERATEGEEREISVSHLTSTADHAIAHLTSALFAHSSSISASPSSSPPPSLHLLSTVAGMAHFIASYYLALPASSSFSSSLALTQVQQLWSSLLSLLPSSSPILQHCLTTLTSSPPPSPSPSLFCFPSAALTSPALLYTDLLLGLTRCLHSILSLHGSIQTWLSPLLRTSSLLTHLLSLLPPLSTMPTLDVHSALLLFYLIQVARLCHQVEGKAGGGMTLPLYRAAVVAVPVLRSCGYHSEADVLTRQALLSQASLSWLQVERMKTGGWQRLAGGGGYSCSHCQWRSRDWDSPAVLQAALLPVLTPREDAEEVKRAAAITGRVAASVDSLVLHEPTSLLTVHRLSTDPTWLVLSFRAGAYLTSSLSPSSPRSSPTPPSLTMSRKLTLTRSYLQYVCLLLDCDLFDSDEARTVLTRAVMEVFMLGGEVYADPSLSPTLTHLTHSLLPSPSTPFWPLLTSHLNSTRGWGYNFFLAFHSLLHLYQAEGMGDAAFTRFVHLGLQRGLVKDYRLAVYAVAGEGGGTVEDGEEEEGDGGEGEAGWGQGWWWPREDSVEVLACYRDYVARYGGDRGRGGGGVLVRLATHHLLCHWFGERAVREGAKVDRERVLQRMGTVDEAVVQALCRYRYYD